MSGTKAEKATSWSIPIVNHTWLEDCFTQWRALTPAQERYIAFPPRVDFSELISARATGGKVVLEPAELEALAREGVEGEGEEVQEVEGAREGEGDLEAGPKVKARAGKENRPPPASVAGPSASASANVSMREVEEAVAGGAPGEVSVGEFLETDIQVEDAQKRPGPDEEMDVDQEEETEMDLEKPRSKGSSPRKYQSRAKALRRRGATRQGGEEEDEDEEARPSTSKSPERQKNKPARSRFISDSDSDVEMDADSPLRGKASKAAAKKSTNAPPKGKGSSSKAVISLDSDEEAMDVDSPVKPKAKTKPTAKDAQPKIGPPKAAPKRAKRAVGWSSQEDEDGPSSRAPRSAAKSTRSAVPESVPPDSPASSKPKAKPVRREVAVVIPPLASPGPSNVNRKPRTKRQPLRAAAAESPASPGKRGRTAREREDSDGESEREASPPIQKPRRKKDKDKDKSTPETEEDSGAGRAVEAPGTVGRTPSRRAAASKATRRLHEEIMPDVVNFQKQLKSGAVKGAWESEASAGASEKSRGKKRASVGDRDAEVEVREDDEPEKKRQKTGAREGKGRSQRRLSGKSARDEEVDEEASDTGGGTKSEAKPASKGRSSTR